jgi:hypothetical protein
MSGTTKIAALIRARATFGTFASRADRDGSPARIS